MFARNWAVVKREEVIDPKSLMNIRRYIVIAEKLTRREAESYLQGDVVSYLEIISLDDLSKLRKDNEVIS